VNITGTHVTEKAHVSDLPRVLRTSGHWHGTERHSEALIRIMV
jgi:hypothetical protein